MTSSAVNITRVKIWVWLFDQPCMSILLNAAFNCYTLSSGCCIFKVRLESVKLISVVSIVLRQLM